MAYIVVENFSAGLDTRRHPLTAKSGTLQVLKNAHITRGGEIEKRKKFAQFASLSGIGFNTFGMEAGANTIYVFGSDAEVSSPGMPPGVFYQRLQHPDGLPMTEVVYSTLYGGYPFVLAKFSDGKTYPFYNGQIVVDFVSGVVRSTMGSSNDIATHMAGVVNSYGSDYSATVVGSTVTVTGPAGIEWKPSVIIDAPMAASVATIQQFKEAVAEVLSSGSFIVTGGTASAGVNTITSVKVDGVEVLGAPVDWVTSNSATMTAIASQINTFTSSVEYVATVESGKLIIRGIAGSGTTPNGKVIAVSVTGNVTIGSVTSMANGKAAIAAVPQKTTFTLSGYLNGGKVTFVATPTLDSANPIYWGATRVANTTPTSLLTYKTKVHLTSSSSLFFSGVNQPTKWGENGTGAGFINLSNNNGGNEVLTGLALYQGQLAAFSRRNVQVWAIDTDPVNNRQGQILSNTGALGAGSIVSVGEIDVFYLSDSGVRSMRARDASNAAVVNDVGTPIDGIILSKLATMTDAQKAACCAIIEPIDGRYWIAIGSQIFVYSYFPNSQVAAWSVYEPGFSVTKFTTKDGRVYARSGNTIYLYGGSTGLEYDSSSVEVVLPYLDGGKPAHMKTIDGIDMTCEGTWGVQMGLDPVAPEARDNIATVSQPTFSLGRLMASGVGTHVGIRMTCNSSGYARIANLIVHYKINESD